MGRSLLFLALLVLPASATAADLVLAVTYFDAHTIRPEIEPLGRGIADMLMTDLQKGRDVRVVERTRLAEVLGELELGRSQFIDERTAQKLGRGLGANTVITGSLTSSMEGLRIDARVVDVGSGEVAFAVQSTGTEDQFFDLERDVALQILDGLGVEHDPAVLGRREGFTLEQALAGSRRIDEADMAFLNRLGALRVYKTRRLKRDTLAFSTVTANGSGGTTVSNVLTWSVYDGGGAVLDALTFANLVGDRRTVDQIYKHRRQGAAGAGVMIGLTVAGFAVGMPALLEGTGRGATAVGVIALVTGGTCGSLLPIAIYFATQSGKFVARYYTPERADELIREYNDELGEELGLDRQDVMQMDLQSRRPPVVVLPVLSFGYAGVVGVF